MSKFIFQALNGSDTISTIDHDAVVYGDDGEALLAGQVYPSLTMDFNDGSLASLLPASIEGSLKASDGVASMLDRLSGALIRMERPRREHRQYRFPRSKKKRIQRKWKKDPRNWRIEEKMTTICLPVRSVRVLPSDGGNISVQVTA